jgi:hypothetical protein
MNSCQWAGCGAEYSDPAFLWSHCKRVHPWKTTCEWDGCGKQFTVRVKYTIHLKTHMKLHIKLPHHCSDCGKSFISASTLKTHTRVHTGERPFNCTECEKSFSTKGALKKHTRVRTGENLFACEICDKSFASVSTLKVHLKFHTNDNPFRCDVCDKSFPRSRHLKIHSRTHTGEKPFACKICDRKLSTLGNLKTHIQTHTGERPFDCDKCDLKFARSFDLKTHTRLLHTGPFCVICAKYWVPDKEMTCGRCDTGTINHGLKERTVFAALSDADDRLGYFIRDTALGCRVRRRPDGWLNLHVDLTDVLFVVEVDEHQHRHYDPSCELKRLEEISDRHGGAVFVLRYNPDQPGGLDPVKLAAFAARCVDILNGDYTAALESFGGLLIEYHGYGDKQIQTLDRAWFGSQV